MNIKIHGSAFAILPFIMFFSFLFNSCQLSRETGYTLVSTQTTANIWIAPGEPEYVKLAVMDLIEDVQKITGKGLQIAENRENCQSCIIIGIMDKSQIS